MEKVSPQCLVPGSSKAAMALRTIPNGITGQCGVVVVWAGPAPLRRW